MTLNQELIQYENWRSKQLSLPDDNIKIVDMYFEYLLQKMKSKNLNKQSNKTKCPNCGTTHPLVAEFGYCGKCAQMMYD